MNRFKLGERVIQQLEIFFCTHEKAHWGCELREKYDSVKRRGLRGEADLSWGKGLKGSAGKGGGGRNVVGMQEAGFRPYRTRSSFLSLCCRERTRWPTGTCVSLPDTGGRHWEKTLLLVDPVGWTQAREAPNLCPVLGKYISPTI